jgi:hypothetical protein
VTGKLYAKAVRLAAKHYDVEYKIDQTIDAKRQVVLASHPQLPGCMAQGDTREEALHRPRRRQTRIHRESSGSRPAYTGARIRDQNSNA